MERFRHARVDAFWRGMWMQPELVVSSDSRDHLALGSPCLAWQPDQSRGRGSGYDARVSAFLLDASSSVPVRQLKTTPFPSRSHGRPSEAVEEFRCEDGEIRAAAISRAVDIHRDGALDPARARSHDDDAVTHVDRLIDVVRDQSIVVQRACQSRSTSSCIRIRVKASSAPSGSSRRRTFG